MGRIEDAIARVRQRAQQASAVSAGVSHEEARSVMPLVSSSSMQPGGRFVDIDVNKLRARGFLAPESDQKRLEEEYRVIRRPVIRNIREAAQSSAQRANLVLVASAMPGDGKSFTSANLCLSLARSKDWDVLLVDGDCRKPQLTHLLGTTEQPGLLDLLVSPTKDPEEFVMPTSIPGLYFLPAGQMNDHASELLASARMDAICDALARNSPDRIVVFDSSPLLSAVDAAVIASFVGQVIVVVCSERTPQQAIVAAVEKLDKAKPVNLVLNQVEGTLFEPQYGYGYGFQDS